MWGLPGWPLGFWLGHRVNGEVFPEVARPGGRTGPGWRICPLFSQQEARTEAWVGLVRAVQGAQPGASALQEPMLREGRDLAHLCVLRGGTYSVRPQRG